MPGRPHWTPREDIRLCEAASEGATWAELEQLLPGRTRQAIAHRVAYHKIPACPAGWYTVAEAARLQTFDPTTFAKLLRTCSIETRPLPRPATLADVSQVRMVEMARVVAKLRPHLERVTARETSGEAARRLGVSRIALYQWARDAKRYRSHGMGRAARLPPRVWDAVARPHLGETLSHAAARLELCRIRLRGWVLEAEGRRHHRRRRVHHHPPEFYDRLAAAHGVARRAAA